MRLITQQDIVEYVERNIPDFHQNRLDKLKRLRLKKAKRILGTNRPTGFHVIAVNGCCYGKDNVTNKGDYIKLCGQRFWEFISGNENLYTEIIEPLGHRAKEQK